MSGEWTGFSTWKLWQEAGVFGDRLDFTDDEIMTHQTIHRTGQMIGKCRAMDAAVAFSLASLGPNGDAEPQELLNDYTRGAYLIETRKVGYGVFRDPNSKSCGHDEVSNVPYIKYRAVQTAHWDSENNVVIFFSTNQALSPKACPDAMVENIPEKYREAFMRPLWRTDAEYSPRTLFKEYLKAKFPALVEILNAPDAPTIVFRSNRPIHTEGVTNGECAWADTHDEIDGKKVKRNCAHHDGAMVKGWAMLKHADNDQIPKPGTDTDFITLTGLRRFAPLYSSKHVRGGWNNNMLKGKDANSKLWRHWITERRSLIQQVDDKEVLKGIKKSLARMCKRNVNVVVKRYKKICNTCGSEHRNHVTECCPTLDEDGNDVTDVKGWDFRYKKRGFNATYGWKDWAWMAEIAEYIRITRSRNRKAGEEANGWEYYATSTRKSYGMEISEFAWKPANEEDVTAWTFVIKGSRSVVDYYGRKKTEAFTPFNGEGMLYFATKEQAEVAAKSVYNSIVQTENAIVASRKYVEGDVIPKPNYSIALKSKQNNFVMNGDVVPEDYLSPAELHELAMAAAPNIVEQHKSKFDKWHTMVVTKSVAAPKQEAE